MKVSACLFLLVPLLSCSGTRISEHKARSNAGRILTLSAAIVQAEPPHFSVDTLKEASLKESLQKLNVHEVEAFYTINPDFDTDSVLVFGARDFFLTAGQIVVDLKLHRGHDLTVVGGGKLIKTGDRVYYRKYDVPMGK